MKSCFAIAGLVLLFITSLACTSNEGQEDAPGTTPTSPAEASPSPTPRNPVVLTPGTGGQPGSLRLDSTPRTPPVAQRRNLGPFVPSVEPPEDRMTTVLYDRQTGTTTTLAPGTIGSFSPDSRFMAWSTLAGNNQSQVWLIDTESKQRRVIGPGQDPRYISDSEVAVLGNFGVREVLDTRTGARSPLPAGVPFPDFSVAEVPGGRYVLKALSTQPNISQALSYSVQDTSTGRTLVVFEAAEAVPGSENELLVATPPNNGLANVYAVALPGGAATYITTVRWQPTNWPLTASPGYIAWTEDFCGTGGSQGKTRILDRSSGLITELDVSFYVRLTPDDLLAFGEFGGKTLVDPRTLQVVYTVPGTEMFIANRDVSWSPDYRFASVGFVSGHGGLCPP